MLVSMITGLSSSCGCQQQVYGFNAAILGKYVKLRLQITWMKALSIDISIRCQSLVPNTSPGFIVLERFNLRLLTMQDTCRELTRLEEQAIIHMTDVNMEGQGYLEVCSIFE